MIDGKSGLMGTVLNGFEPLREGEVLAALMLRGRLLRLNDGMSVLRKVGQQPLLFDSDPSASAP